MDSPDPTPDAAPVEHGRRQSRRIWIIAALLLACGGWLGWRVYRGAQQAKAVKQIESLGGFVVYDYQGRRAHEPQGWPVARKVLGDQYFVTATAAHVRGEQFKVAQLEQLVPSLQSLNLESLNIEGTWMGDGLVGPLCKVTGVRQLYIHDRRLTDKGFKQLKDGLPNTQIHRR